MKERPLKYRSFPFRHRLISVVGDINIKGFRKLATLLPKWLMPNPNDVDEHILQSIHGVALRINPKVDKGVELSLFQTGTYEKGVLNFIKNNYQADGTFVDVGANIGLMSLFTAFNFKKSKIHAFEAHPETIKILKENVAINELSNIQIHPFGLAAENKDSVIYDNWQVNRGGASLVVKSEDSQAYPIELKKFDELNVAKEKVEMVKVDVEGYEMEVLKGMEKTLKRDTPVVIVEISENRVNTHDNSAQVVDFIRSMGPYSFYKLVGGKERKSRLTKIKNSSEMPSHDNIFCIAD